MFEQRTIVNQIEIDPDRVVGVRFDKQLWKDGALISAPKYHRAAYAPGDDFEASIDPINQHLVSMGEEPPTEEEWQRVREVIEQQHTPEAIEAYQAKTAIQDPPVVEPLDEGA